MEGVGLSKSLVASLLFMICMYTPSSMSSPTTKLLKVGVPFQTNFTKFVSINAEENETNVTVGGFCVEVFEVAIQTLNYSMHYIPIIYEDYAKANEISSYYDYAINQIVLKV